MGRSGGYIYAIQAGELSLIKIGSAASVRILWGTCGLPGEHWLAPKASPGGGVRMRTYQEESMADFRAMEQAFWANVWQCTRSAHSMPATSLGGHKSAGHGRPSCSSPSGCFSAYHSLVLTL
jgi:hypothetical protein